MNFFERLRNIANRIGGRDGTAVRKAANSLEHIGLDDSFVPLPNFPGYFWNKKEEKLYSVKVRGEMRPLKEHSQFFYRRRYRSGKVYTECAGEKPHYQLSVEGQPLRITTQRIKQLVA